MTTEPRIVSKFRTVSGRATCTRRSIRSATVYRAAVSGPGGRWTSVDLTPGQAADLAEVLRLALTGEALSGEAPDLPREGDASAIPVSRATAISSIRNGRPQVVVEVAPHEPGDFSLAMSPGAALALAHQLVEAANGQPLERRGWCLPWRR